MTSLSHRLVGVVSVLFDHGQNDAAHHLRWVIDQALREATGTPDGYRAAVRCWEQDHPGCTWETGIAP